jgi:hypothetical protein
LPPPAAVGAAVSVEPPVQAVVDSALLAVLEVARRVHRVPLLRLAPLPVVVRAHLPVLVPLVPAGLPALADLVVAPAAPLRLLSRLLFSAAPAGSTRSPGPPTYEPGPR